MKQANLISFHVVYKVKEEDNGRLERKGGLVLHCNGDRDRFSVLCDSASSDLTIFRLLIVLVQTLDFNIANAVVNGGLMCSSSRLGGIFMLHLLRI